MEWKGRVANLARSSLIGIGLGISKKFSPRGENFGKGEPGGLIPASYIVVRAFGQIMNFPPPLLLGLIVVCSLVGVYIPSGVFFDVPVASTIGLLAMRLYDFPITPLLMGYVLADINAKLEKSLEKVMLKKTSILGLAATHNNII